jgi:hypothetical protein
MKDLVSITSDEINSKSKVENIYNDYLSLQARFDSLDPHIAGKWDVLNPADCDTFIISNTNADTVRIILKDDRQETLYDSGIVLIDEEILIVKMEEFYIAWEIEIFLEGSTPVGLGYVWLGREVILPRFKVNPIYEFDPRQESNRTMGGQVYGIPQAPLRTFSAEFFRDENAAVLESYAASVLNIYPHVIDPYYEAHKKFPPLYVTLVNGYKQTKRAESGFYWDYSLSWTEAK